MLDLARLNQLLYGTRHVFNGDVWVNPMLIEQIDDVGPEPLERAFDGPFDVLGPAVQTSGTGPMIAATQIESELGGDDHLIAVRGERLADLIGIRLSAFSTYLAGSRDQQPPFEV